MLARAHDPAALQEANYVLSAEDSLLQEKGWAYLVQADVHAQLGKRSEARSALVRC